MIMTGVNDLRTPVGQAEEFYEALRVRKVHDGVDPVQQRVAWKTSSTPSNPVSARTQLRI